MMIYMGLNSKDCGVIEFGEFSYVLCNFADCGFKDEGGCIADSRWQLLLSDMNLDVLKWWCCTVALTILEAFSTVIVLVVWSTGF